MGIIIKCVLNGPTGTFRTGMFPTFLGNSLPAGLPQRGPVPSFQKCTLISGTIPVPADGKRR